MAECVTPMPTSLVDMIQEAETRAQDVNNRLRNLRDWLTPDSADMSPECPKDPSPRACAERVVDSLRDTQDLLDTIVRHLGQP